MRTSLLVLMTVSCGHAAPPDDAGVPVTPEPIDAGSDDAGAEPPSSLATCSLQQQNCPASEACAVRDATFAQACFFGRCDVVRQDCPSGERCTHVREGRVATRRCVVAGTKAEREACGGDLECSRGLRCVEGACRRYCHQTSHCGPSQVCTSAVVVAPEGELALTCRTLMACDPFAPTCRAGQACSLTSTGPVCLTAGVLVAGEACRLSTAACASGLHCLVPSVGAEGRCEALCNLDGGSPGCGTGACRPVGDSGFGSCRTP